MNLNEFGIYETDPWDLDLPEILPQVFFKSGGGSSGEVDFPEYMKTRHEDWLDDINSLISQTSSPFTGVLAYDPDDDLAAALAAVQAFGTAISGIDAETDWEAAFDTAKAKWDTVLGDSAIEADVTAFGDLIADDINDNVLPAFQTGMRDVNAVVTSAYPIGEANIWAKKTKEMTKHGTALKLNAQQIEAQLISDSAKAILHQIQVYTEFSHTLAHMTVEYYRIKIVAKKEEADKQIELDEKDARWTFDLYQYGADMMGSISGGTTGAGAKPSAAASAIGGALSGAAAGAMMTGGNPVGIGVGAVLGLAGGLL